MINNNIVNNTEFDPDIINSKFKDIKDMIDEKFNADASNKSDNSKVIYVCGPVTGIDDYKTKFDEMVSFLQNDDRFKDCIIINPMDYFDTITTGDYISDCLLSMYLEHRADTIILDDRTELWKFSRGTLIELTFATASNKNILSFKSLSEVYNGITII